ncbi:N-acetylglucosamine repressor [Streptomyces sp. RB17]|uniref:ROK family transcriptional regulator n=1 Tax=Streptomyces sp. RB17 TaxID=2585197 RepID=UPI0013071EFB|nr:ROK family transcriptional regulator [Streptomyces sp. RB17]MQY33476.1 N-acetylglucosamine repressor [Streptomyces sp. RB17]
MAAVGGRTVRDLRRESRSAVLQRLYVDGPMSRHALGPATGLSSGSVSNVVTGLLADGLVEEAGTVGADAGRPSRLLRIRPDSGRLIGVDVGETRVRVELLDLGLAELACVERPLGPRGYDIGAVVGHVADGVAEVVRAAGLPVPKLLGVGVGVPGIVEDAGRKGAVVHGQTVGWDAVPLERLLRASVQLPPHLPYFIENGAKALGQAEMWFGGGRGARNAVVVLLGSGVGACVVTEEAARGRAVEWGHLTVRVAGRRCRCGAFGCLEAYAGAAALVARWREAGGRPSDGAGEERALTELLAAARPGGGREPDPVAAAVLAETAEYLGAGLSDLINLFQPERVLIGGWAGLQLGDAFLDQVRTHALTRALRHPAARVRIELGRLGPDAVTIGAAVLPLAAFFATGGHRPRPAPEGAKAPTWRAGVEGRLV